MPKRPFLPSTALLWICCAACGQEPAQSGTVDGSAPEPAAAPPPEQPPAAAAPAAAAAADAAPTGASTPATFAGPARAVMHEGRVLACIDGGGIHAGPSCAGTMTAVGVYRPVGGDVLLHELETHVQQQPDGGPCTAGPAAGVEPSGGTWVPVRRPMTNLPLASSTYTRLIAELTGVAAPKLTALLRIDLDNDGQAEVLFTADSHPSGPKVTDASSFAAAGLRRLLADGSATTQLFVERRVSTTGEGPDTTRVSLLGFTDLENDGRLEVVTLDAHERGETRSIWRLGDDGLTSIGSTNCTK